MYSGNPQARMVNCLQIDKVAMRDSKGLTDSSAPRRSFVTGSAVFNFVLSSSSSGAKSSVLLEVWRISITLKRKSTVHSKKSHRQFGSHNSPQHISNYCLNELVLMAGQKSFAAYGIHLRFKSCDYIYKNAGLRRLRQYVDRLAQFFELIE